MQVLTDAQQNFTRITASVGENDKSVLTETIDFLSIVDPDWSLSPTHIRLLGACGKIEIAVRRMRLLLLRSV